jgi:peptide/nickel transport system substrate-binding protein
VRVSSPRLYGAALLLAIAALTAPAGESQAAGPGGQATYAFHVTLAPRWLDPGETESAITPFKVLYAIHDALVKPMPAGQTTASLAESWTMSPDGASYTFLLRQNIKFHNGEAVTPDDVKFSFDRYKGGAAKLLKEKVKEVQIVDARRVKFVLREPWPDFMTFYGTTATGAGWIVPKKYVEKVGEEGFLKAPIGAGPLPLRQLDARHRDRPRGVRGLLAQGAERETDRPEERSG